MPAGAMKRLFVESSSSNSGREATAGAVLCAPRPRRVQVHPCSADLILGPPPFLLSSNTTKKQREGGKSKSPEGFADGGEEDGSWGVFGGPPPARADNPLVHDPHFLLNQRPAAVAAGVPELSIFDHHRHSHHHHSHLPSYSHSNSSSSSFAAPAVRIQGFDVAACRSSHGGAGGRVLSARA